MSNKTVTPALPGLDCGLCGFRTCVELAAKLEEKPELLNRCIYLSGECLSKNTTDKAEQKITSSAAVSACTVCSQPGNDIHSLPGCIGCSHHTDMSAVSNKEPVWKDSLDRDFDFYLDHFPEDPGPREIIMPFNHVLTKELDIHPGDYLMGRPLGVSCGCPISHCGVVTDVDHRTGVIVWCITGPLKTRQEHYKDLGYYSAQAYEGMVRQARVHLKIGMRYYFQPRMCMLQWRHSGLLNYLNKTSDGYQIRLEGLWIG